MSNVIQVITTTASREEAERIARALVDGRLAACVQVVGPITSTYRWEGAIESAQEWRCEAKSRPELYGEIENAIRGLHSYQVPEILALPVAAGSADYLAWLDREVKRPGGNDE